MKGKKNEIYRFILKCMVMVIKFRKVEFVYELDHFLLRFKLIDISR